MDNDHELILNQVNTLTDRRQAVTATYLSVNAALTGAMAFLFKDGQLTSLVSEISVLTLLFSGVVACSLWRRLIMQYSRRVDWWYAQLRALEDTTPHSRKLINKEYKDLYQRQAGKKSLAGMTSYETSLTWLFTLIYTVFALAILIVLIFHLH